MNRDYGKKGQGFANGGLMKGVAVGGNGSSGAPASSFGPDSELPGQDGPAPTSRPASFVARMKNAVSKSGKSHGKPFGKGK